jgi:uncharacterized FAD-dependent dehydrogenase
VFVITFINRPYLFCLFLSGPVLLLEQGKDLDKRRHEAVEDRICGWGGAGAYSDGKLTLSTHVGGVLGEYLEERWLHQLLETADNIYAAHGAPDRILGKDCSSGRACGQGKACGP